MLLIVGSIELTDSGVNLSVFDGLTSEGRANMTKDVSKAWLNPGYAFFSISRYFGPSRTYW
jgi:hypothetical protein